MKENINADEILRSQIVQLPEIEKQSHY